MLVTTHDTATPAGCYFLLLWCLFACLVLIVQQSPPPPALLPKLIVSSPLSFSIYFSVFTGKASAFFWPGQYLFFQRQAKFTVYHTLFWECARYKRIFTFITTFTSYFNPCWFHRIHHSPLLLHLNTKPPKKKSKDKLFSKKRTKGLTKNLSLRNAYTICAYTCLAVNICCFSKRNDHTKRHLLSLSPDKKCSHKNCTRKRWKDQGTHQMVRKDLLPKVYWHFPMTC